MRPASRRLGLGLGLLALCGRAFGQSLDFVPPGGTEEGQSVSLQASFNSGVPPAYAYLFLRSIGQASYLPLVMRINGSQLQAEIPGSFLKPPGVEYYLSVVDIDNQTFTFPAVAPTANPLQLTVSPKPSGFFFTAVYPYDRLTIAEPSPLIHVEYTQVGGGLEPSSLKVEVDGVSVSTDCQIEVGEMFCPVSWEIAQGTHSVVVEGRSREGPAALPLQYSFTRGTPPKKGGGAGFSFQGKAVPEIVHVHVGRRSATPSFMLIPSRESRTFPELELDAIGRQGKADLALSVRHTGVDRQEQPSPSRYSLSVKDKWTTLDLGDFQGSWSDLGLGYTRVRGLRVNHAAVAKVFSVEVFGGQTRRQIELPEFNTGIFARYLAGMTGLLQWERRAALRLYGLQGEDDRGSVRGTTFIKPIASKVAGAELTVGLAKDVKAAAELAFNRYRPDLSLGEERAGRAYQLRLSQDAALGSWSAAYRDVTPNFVSLGNAYLQNDYRGVEAQGSARAPDGRLMLASSLQAYRDNTDSRKVSTFRFFSHQTNLSARPLPKGPSLTLGFGEQRQTSESDVVFDLHNRTRNWVTGVSQSFGPFNAGYNFTLTQFRDLSAAAFSDSFDGRFHTATLSMTVAPINVGTTLGYNLNHDLRSGNRTRNVNYSVRAAGTFGRLKVETAHSGNVGKDTQSLIDSRQLNTVAKVEWQQTKSSFWRARYEDISVTNNVAPGQSYKESRSSLAYGFAF